MRLSGLCCSIKKEWARNGGYIDCSHRGHKVPRIKLNREIKIFKFISS